MTQNEKNLLLKDLCARLPYGVKVEIYKDEPPYKLKGYDGKDFLSDSGWDYLIEQCKPYLFPLSSMTEEQKIECFNGRPLEIDKYGDIAVKDDFYGGSQYTDLGIYLEVIDWLNKTHFDYRGLIEKGLAIDATGLNIY